MPVMTGGIHADPPPGTDVLREIGLFGGLTDGVLADLAVAHAIVEAKVGEVLFEEGAPGRDLYVVLEGEVELTRRNVEGVLVRVTVCRQHEWFGEMSMLDMLPRQATATAIVPARLLRITAHDLDHLYRKEVKLYALFVLNMARELSRRLRAADAALADAGLSEKR